MFLPLSQKEFEKPNLDHFVSWEGGGHLSEKDRKRGKKGE